MPRPPKHKTAAARSGLTVGTLGPGMGGVVNASRRLQAAIIAELQARGETLTVWHLGVIQTCVRWERVALGAQKVCRQADALSPRAKLDALQRCAFASAKRDECLKLLGLDQRPDEGPLAFLTMAPVATLTRLEGDSGASGTPPERKPTSGPLTQPMEVSDVHQ